MAYEQIMARAFDGGNELRLFLVTGVKYIGFKRTDLYELVFLENSGDKEYTSVCSEHYRVDEAELAYIAFEIRAVSKNPWEPTKYQRPLEYVIPECVERRY
jgi:hypothetical protein